MQGTSARGAIIFATGLEERTISRHFQPEESGTLLEYVLDSVWTVADELFVVFKSEPKLSLVEAISPFGVKILNSSSDPIDAISSAFRAAKSEHCLFTTEQVPLLKPNVVLSLFEATRGSDAAIPRWSDGRIEPTLAVYRKNAFIRLVKKSRNSLSNNVEVAFKSLAGMLFDTNYVSIEKELKELDPELDSFLKVKNDKSLRKAREKANIKNYSLKKRGY